jgi:hypothetical protein
VTHRPVLEQLWFCPQQTPLQQTMPFVQVVLPQQVLFEALQKGSELVLQQVVPDVQQAPLVPIKQQVEPEEHEVCPQHVLPLVAQNGVAALEQHT